MDSQTDKNSATNSTKTSPLENSTKDSKNDKRTYTRLDFTTEHEEQLIEFVKANEALYNPSDSLYKNRNHRDHLWAEFAVGLGLNT